MYVCSFEIIEGNDLEAQTRPARGASRRYLEMFDMRNCLSIAVKCKINIPKQTPTSLPLRVTDACHFESYSQGKKFGGSTGW